MSKAKLETCQKLPPSHGDIYKVLFTFFVFVFWAKMCFPEYFEYFLNPPFSEN